MFKVINASAGSGKTYTLVKEYLVLLFKNTDNYKHVLAITFTNKAAAEMKERIITALEHIAEPEKYMNSSINKYMLPDIAKELPQIAADKFPEKAKECLSKILHNYYEFAVSTIDSFSHKIIRAFSHDMQIASGFSIELDFGKLIDEAVSNLFARAGSDEELTEFLINYIDHLHESESSKAFERPIIELAQVLSNEKIRLLLEKSTFVNSDIAFFKGIITEFYSEIDLLENKLRATAQHSIDAMASAGLTPNDFWQKAGGIAGYFAKVLDKLDEVEKFSYAKKAIDNYDDNDKWISKESKNNNVLTVKPILLEDFNKIQVLTRELIDCRIILANLHTYALLNQIAQEIDLIKSEQNILPISEFNTKISNIVAQSEAPYIYERIGEKYNHIMVDEFQDTSILQWQNIIPLIDNSLSNSFKNIIVGDGKQAIYIWRNGEVRQFTSLPSIYKSLSSAEITAARENSFERNIERINLDKNYRSAKTIVEFNNHLFKYFSENNYFIKDEAYKNIFDSDLFIQKPNSKATGYVEVRSFEFSTGMTAEYSDFNVKQTHEIIQKLHDEYGYAYGDIAVLSYSGKHGQLIGGYLLEQGIDVVSPDSLHITSSPKIHFITSIINMLTKQSNEIDLNVGIKFLCEQANRAEAYETLSKSIDKRFPHIKSFANICKQFNINFDVPKLSFYSCYELCEHLITLFNLEVKDVFIQRLLNSFQENPKLTLTEYPEWFKNYGEKIFISSVEGKDAVQISTIHKSKGLEFPIVISPFTDYDITPKGRATYMHVANKTKNEKLDAYIIKYAEKLERSSYADEFEEEKESKVLDKINLLYVALTRAKDQLYIITKKEKSSTDTFGAHKIICNFVDSTECNNLNPNRIDDNCVSFGELNKKTETEKSTPNTIDLESTYHNWRTRLRIATSPQNYSPENRQAYSSEEIEWGKIFHAAISFLKTPQDIANIHLLQNAETLTTAQSEKILQLFNMLIADKAVNKLLFDYDKVYIEKEMINAAGQFFRADRITVKDGVYNIIDFKTGKENTKDIKQVANYCEILRSMGVAQVNGFIVYCGESVGIVECM